MQSIFTGRGNGGRIRTLLSGTPASRCRSLFKRAAIIGEAFDQAADEIMRPGVRNILSPPRHIHDSIAFEHAELEIVEKQNFHTCSSKIIPRDITEMQARQQAEKRSFENSDRSSLPAILAHCPAVQAREILTE